MTKRGFPDFYVWPNYTVCKNGLLFSEIKKERKKPKNVNIGELHFPQDRKIDITKTKRYYKVEPSTDPFHVNVEIPIPPGMLKELGLDKNFWHEYQKRRAVINQRNALNSIKNARKWVKWAFNEERYAPDELEKIINEKERLGLADLLLGFPMIGFKLDTLWNSLSYMKDMENLEELKQKRDSLDLKYQNSILPTDEEFPTYDEWLDENTMLLPDWYHGIDWNKQTLRNKIQIAGYIAHDASVIRNYEKRGLLSTHYIYSSGIVRKKPGLFIYAPVYNVTSVIQGKKGSTKNRQEAEKGHKRGFSTFTAPY